MGFAYPFLFWALALVAVPVIIHLFYFRRYKKVYFSSTRFLKEVQEQQKKAGRLQRLLILASRVLAIIFLVLAFMQPFLGSKTEAGPAAAQQVVLYLDNTFSMSLRKDNRDLLDISKEYAAAIIDKLGQTDRVMVLTNDLNGSFQRWMPPAEARALLDEIRISPSTKTLDEILARLSTISKELPGEELSFYALTDLQDYAFPAEWPETDFTTYFLPVSVKAPSNLYVDSVWLADPVVYRQAVNKLVVQVANSGGSEANGRLTLQLDGETRAMSDVKIAAGATVKDTLSFSIRNTGWQKGLVSVQDFPISFDDKMYFAFEAAASNKVLLLEEVSSSRAVLNVFRTDAHFAADKIEASRVELSAIPSYNLVVLNEVRSISPSLSKALSDYVKNGGSVYFIPSEEGNLESYNNFLKAVGGPGLSPKVAASAAVTQMNDREPVVQVAFERIPRNLDLPAVKSYYPVSSNAAGIERFVLKMDNGRSFLSSYQFGIGLLYLQASSLQASATDFSGKAIFPPLVYNMAVFKASPRPLYYTIGAPAQVPGIEAVSGTEQVIKLRSGDFEVIPPVQPVGNRLSVGIPADLERDGVFEIMRGGRVLEVIAANFSRKESAMQFISPEELKAKYQGKKVEVIAPAELRAGVAVAGLGGTTPLWKLCLILALIFLTIEMLLLRWASSNTTP